MDENAISRYVLDSAMKVHTALGCGLLENIYETCLAYELDRCGLEVRKQVVVPVRYEEAILDMGYRLDLLVGDKVVVEVKAVEKVLALHRAQLLTNLKLGGFKLVIATFYSLVKERRCCNKERRCCNEAETEDLLPGNSEGVDVGSLAKRRFFGNNYSPPL